MLKNKLYIILLLFFFNNKIQNEIFWKRIRITPIKFLNEKTKKHDYDIGIIGLKILDYRFLIGKHIFKIKRLVNFEIPRIIIFGYKLKAWLILPFLTKFIYNNCDLINKKGEKMQGKEKLGFFRGLNPFNFYNALFYKILEWRQNTNKNKELINDKTLNSIIKTNNFINNSYVNWTWNWIFLSKKIYDLNNDEEYLKKIQDIKSKK